MKRERLDIAGGLGVMRAGRHDAPPVILLHGYSGDVLAWQFQLAALARHYRVTALDLPGHGLSSSDYLGTWRRMIDWLDAVIDALDPGQPVRLVGHSLGGRLALGYAERRPTRVAAIATLACAGLTERFDLAFLQRLAAIDDLAEAQACARRLLGSAAMDAGPLAQALLSKLGTADAQVQLGRYLAENFIGERMHGHDLPAWERIPCPLLMIWGSDDTIVAEPGALPATIELHRLDHVGHLPHLVEPEAVNRLLLEFFAAGMAPAQTQRISVAAQE